jgi:hypothetical protein
MPTPRPLALADYQKITIPSPKYTPAVSKINVTNTSPMHAQKINYEDFLKISAIQDNCI